MFTINHRIVHALMGFVYLSSCVDVPKDLVSLSLFFLYMLLVADRGD